MGIFPKLEFREDSHIAPLSPYVANRARELRAWFPADPDKESRTLAPAQYPARRMLAPRGTAANILRAGYSPPTCTEF